MEARGAVAGDAGEKIVRVDGAGEKAAHAANRIRAQNGLFSKTGSNKFDERSRTPSAIIDLNASAHLATMARAPYTPYSNAEFFELAETPRVIDHTYSAQYPRNRYPGDILNTAELIGKTYRQALGIIGDIVHPGDIIVYSVGGVQKYRGPCRCHALFLDLACNETPGIAADDQGDCKVVRADWCGRSRTISRISPMKMIPTERIRKPSETGTTADFEADVADIKINRINPW
jgi:hypothetical protein